jgi:sulfide:quinone oxidoreductase
VKWVKIAFEEYFMTKMRWGVGMPWFEKLGLKILFGLSLLKPVSLLQNNNQNIINRQSQEKTT